MIRGLPASIAFHAGIFAVGYVSWPFVMASSRIAQTESIVVPIELVDIGALNNLAPVLRRDPEPEDEIVPEVVEEDPEDPIEEPDPVDETLPEDEIDTATQKTEPEEIEPEEAAPNFETPPEEPEDTPEPEPETPKAVVKKDDPLNTLLDSLDETFTTEIDTRKRQELPKILPKPLLQDTPPKPQEARRGAGERNANTIRLEGLLRAQVKSCWQGVDDLPGAKDLNVEMQILISEDGYLREAVKLISPSRKPLGRSPMRTAIERALTAVRKCEPYRLPKQDYADWDDYNTIRLGPKYEQD